MKELLIWACISGCLFLGFLIMITIGLIRQNKNLVIISTAFFFGSGAAAAYTGYVVITRSYDKVAALLKPRTSNEIYTALFGKPNSACLKILDYRDQVILKLDASIMLHAKTCPEEVQRILSQHQFDLKKISAKQLMTEAAANWFKPEKLGDTVLMYTMKRDAFGNDQTIYSNTGQTEMYYIEVRD